MAFRSKKPFLLVAAVCLALAPWPVMVKYQNLSAEYESQVSSLRDQTEPLQQRLSQITRTEERAREIGKSIEQVKGLVNSKANWIQFFAELQESLMQAEDVWLDDLAVKREQVGDTPNPETADSPEELDSQGGASTKPSYEIVLKGQMLVRDSATGGGINRQVLTRRIKELQTSFENSEFIETSQPPSINWKSLNQGLNVLPFTIDLVVDTSKTL